MALWNTENNNGVVIAAYNNPPMNYFCAEGAQELGALIEQFAAPEIRAVVLTGGINGKFITHYSVEELHAAASDREAMRAAGTSLTVAYHAMLKGLEDLPKPVIVAMNGDAMGGGFELCLSCDIRIADSGDHRFGLPEVKLGILPGGSGTQRLSRLIGEGRAIEFMLRGRVVPPAKALELGLVHEVADNALERAESIAAELAAQPPLAMACIKHAVYRGSDTNLETGLAIEDADFFQTMMSDDGVAAMQTYLDVPLEKRRDWIEQPKHPEYSGK